MFEIVVRAILRDKNGNILLVKRVKKPEQGKWSLPGGKTELKEYSVDAIIREIKEELQLTFQPNFKFYKEDLTSIPDKHCIVLYFKGEFTGKIKYKTDEIADINFFSLEEIAKSDQIAFDHKEILLSYLN